MTELVVFLVFLILALLVLLNRENLKYKHAQAQLDWVDERERVLAPLVRYAGAIHYGGAPPHSIMEVDGIPTTVEVPVPDADPKALPESTNWVVRGDRVYEQRPSVIPSKGGMEQIHLLMEMEYERRKLIQPLREAWVKLAEWEKKNPVPS